MNNLPDQIFLNESFLNDLFVDIDEIIWSFTHGLNRKIDCRWNLIFLLHHQIILELGYIIAPHFGYPKIDSDKHKSSLVRSGNYHNGFITNTGFHFHSIASSFIIKFLCFCASCACFDRDIQLVYYSKKPKDEILALDNLLNNLKNFLSHKGLVVEIDSNLFLENLQIRKINFFTPFKFPRILFTGSRLPVKARLLAINTLNTHGLVISSTHGERNNTVLNEPFLKYSELTACTYLYEYGSQSCALHVPDEYRPIRVFHRPSKVVSKLLKTSQPTESFSPQFFYIPTLLSGDTYYFPFRQITDACYIDHWDYLLSSDPFIMICLHPKNKSDACIGKFKRFLDKWNSRVCVIPFGTLLEDQYYKYFLLDYHSTVSTQLIAAKKSICYLDIGLRNPQPEYLEPFMSYCHYFHAFYGKFSHDQLDTRSLRVSMNSRNQAEIDHARSLLLTYSV